MCVGHSGSMPVFCGSSVAIYQVNTTQFGILCSIEMQYQV